MGEKGFSNFWINVEESLDKYGSKWSRSYKQIISYEYCIMVYIVKWYTENFYIG